ncbi:hypothetical protein SORDD24_01945 [Streptococcus oralis]|uniref:Uncharacterized protein n=1 Tax=Streptococcus oralis TaxID=1303 RepID=A0A139QL11_STROR|nr:hypothetical protein SORDD24_01945 [Streptococcus oralis]QBX17474.1 hypothetical protein Javan355_0036 [Streptococcus phage Javan355]
MDLTFCDLLSTMYAPAPCEFPYLVVMVLLYCSLIEVACWPLFERGKTLLVHSPLRWPIMSTRSLFWGTPKFLLLIFSHSTLYPNSSKAPRMVSNVAPPSWLRSPLTFSRNRYLGLRIDANLAISKKRLPRVSSKPRLFPAMLKAWHGNPPQIMSTRPIPRINSSDTAVMSCNSISPFVLCIAL